MWSYALQAHEINPTSTPLVAGDVKELRETPSKRQHKFVEFFDVRAAARALQSLDGTELGGKHVKIEFSRPGGQARRAQAARAQPGPPNFAPPNPGNSVSPPGPPPVFNVMGWDRAMQSNGGGFGPQNGGGGMAPPLFMFLPAFPGGQMDPGGPLMPGECLFLEGLPTWVAAQRLRGYRGF
jgi:hypothetical protein